MLNLDYFEDWEDWEEKFIKAFDNGEKFSESVLSNLIDSEVDEIRYGARRWSETVNTVIEAKGRHFSIEWENGLTENQENTFDEQPIEVEKKKKKVTKIITTWVEKESDNIEL